jgi:hypothetical protein
MNNNINLKDLARAEAIVAAQRDEMMDTLRSRYEKACEEQNAEDAAMFARKIRNKLLENSDNKLALDRLGLVAPSGSTFTAWLSFLKALGNVLTGAWAKYRQALRDLPDQPGFPFNIEFPTEPTSEAEE